MKLYDISQQIDENLTIYPGDAPIRFQQLRKVENDKWNLTALSLGAHSGTHLDTELHISPKGRTVAELTLDQCYGRAIVVDLSHIKLGESISAEDLKKNLPPASDCRNLIVILKTGNTKVGYREFHEDWVDLSEKGARLLQEYKVKAVGIDSLTIGSYDCHRELLLNGVIVYEGLNLRLVSPGEYIFMGFPLKLKAEGAPVRAVLLKE